MNILTLTRSKIEVVPFFHSMAGTITDIVGEDDPEAVIATTITSYALSSMLTGTVFYLMGKFKFGYLVGFIPRHILIGCIGGVGWFLVATGFEVTARLDGSLSYDLDTLKRLIQSDTIPLWTIPLGLAIVLFYGQTKITSKYFLPLYILTIPALFYMVSFMMGGPDPDSLQKHGWVFEGPPPGEPWWYFYTLYSKHSLILDIQFHLLTLSLRRIPQGRLECHCAMYPRNVCSDLLWHPTCAYQCSRFGAKHWRRPCRPRS